MLGLVVSAEWPLLMQGSGCASIFHIPNPFALHHPTWRAMYILLAQKISPTGVLIHTFAWFLHNPVEHGCDIDLDWVYCIMMCWMYQQYLLSPFMAWRIWQITNYGSFESVDEEWHGLICGRCTQKPTNEIITVDVAELTYFTFSKLQNWCCRVILIMQSHSNIWSAGKGLWHLSQEWKFQIDSLGRSRKIFKSVCQTL